MIFPTQSAALEAVARMKTDAVVVPSTHGHWAITSPNEAAAPAKVCSICYEAFGEFRNNAWPITKGHCCAYCDDHVVTPARIELARGGLIA